MKLKPHFQAVIDKHARLSGGDKSCVLAMLQSQASQQLTSRGSPHDQFYLALEELGWAHRAKLDDKLEQLGVVAAWTITPEGRANIPALLVASQISQHADEHENHLLAKFSHMAAKFALAYGLFYALSILAVYSLTRAGVKLAPVQDLLFVGLLAGSCWVGVFAAVTPWTLRQDETGPLNAIGLLDATASNKWHLLACFAPFLLIFHLALDLLILRFDTAQAARLVGTTFTRSVVMTALVCALCSTLLPTILDARKKRLLKS